MWQVLSNVSHWPLWNFLSVVLIVWITQRVIAWRERRTKLADVQRELYLATIPHLAQFYKLALEQPIKGTDFLELTAPIFRDYVTILYSRQRCGNAELHRVHALRVRTSQ